MPERHEQFGRVDGPAPRRTIHTGAGAATAFPMATDAALEMLRAGGNAVDAAVAAAWALCVCEPSASGLGGQTILLLHRADGRTLVVDGHAAAPAAASVRTISKRQQRIGHRSCTVPTTPATLDYAQRTYGVLSRGRVMAPAIHIAEDGYRLTALQHRQTRWVAADLRRSDAGALFLRDGQPPAVGTLCRQPQLAAVLCRLADQGIDDFYRGDIARSIADDMRHHDGLITAQDLAAVTAPIVTEPLSIDCRGYRLLSVPPPGGGLELLLAYRMLEQLLPEGAGVSDEDWRELVVLIVYTIFNEREHHPIAPDSLTPAQRKWLVSSSRARYLLSDTIDFVRHQPAAAPSAASEEPGDTTHLTVSDHAGNVVLLTQSIQSVFGAKVVHPRLGFVYNNYLCTCPRHPHPYQLGGHCRPRSNAAPLLVLGGGAGAERPILALGAAGSRRIISSVLQVTSGVLHRQLDIAAAITAPRLHALLSRTLWIERPAASPSLLSRLRTSFPKIVVKARLDYSMGAVQGLQFGPDGTVWGAADPRRDGTVTRLDDETPLAEVP